MGFGDAHRTRLHFARSPGLRKLKIFRESARKPWALTGIFKAEQRFR